MRMKPRNLRLSTIALSFLLLSLTSASLFNFSHANPGIFKITLLVPVSNPARQSWSLVVQNNLQSLGIDAGRVVFDFTTVLNRCCTQPTDLVGKTYDQGGYDTVFIGNALGIDPDPAQLYNSTVFAPTGNNYPLWNNTRNDQLNTMIDRTVDRTARIDLIKQWQALAQDEVPAATILYTKEIVAYDNKMPNAQYVFTTYHFPYWAPIEQLSTNPPDASIILAQTGPSPSKGLIPELSDSYYDTTVSSVIFASIAQRNDTIFKTMIPQLGTGTSQSPGWSVASDNKTWTVTLRQGLTWTDGVPFNATDVKFTFDSYQDSTLGSPTGAFVRGIIGGPSGVTIVDPYTVKFTLPQVYAYFVQNILTTAILPKHILSSIPLSNWKASSFNTGQGGPGPVGMGPYKYVDYTVATATNHLTRNDNYFDFPVNGKAALQSRGAFQVKDYYVQYVAGSDQAISFLKTGAVDVLDSQYHIETQQAFLQSWTSPNGFAVYDAYGIQEMAFNMQHPVFGTGTDTPLGKQDPSKAALAAKYVRQAISHAIPRQLIIDQLLYGYGKPGITSAVTPAMDGFNTALTPHDFNLTESRILLQQAGYFPTPASTPSFLDAYGIYLIGALVAAVVALAGVFVLRVRRRPVVGSTQTTTTPTLATTP